MIGLDEFLILNPEGKLLEGEEGSALLNPIKPTTCGLKMIDAPNGVSNGLAYRINGCNLERILVTEEEEDSTSSTKVVSSCILFGAMGAVHLKASPDGRLVAVACIDGSIQCYDSTATNISLRWSIPHAHSHVTSNISNSISADRKHAACGSGPVLALDFSPYNYNLVLVDAIKGMAIYDARGAEPINLISHASLSQQKLVENISSASWRVSFPTKECDGPIPIAVGRFDGSIAILSCNSKVNSIDLVKPVFEIGCPSKEDGFVCTHLNWTSNTLVAGLCRVIPPEDKEAPDEDDEDDNADHEACLYLTSIDDSLNRCTAWMDQGDVVPFFTVPKFGRHVFFTSFLPSAARSELIAVGTNVGSDIGTIIAQNQSNDDNDTCWKPVEFQEGAAATTPTNEDDEYAFPLGISILQLSSSSLRLLLAATDGSLSTFKFQHKNDSEYFSTTVLRPTADLPSEPLVTMIKSLSETSISTSPPQTPESTSWVVVDENKNDNLGSKEASVLPTTTITEPKTEEVPPANTTNSNFSFGSSVSSGFSLKAGTTQTAPESTGTQKKKTLSFEVPGSSVFGAGNTCGLTFGSPNSGSSPLISLEKKVGETSVFGAVSSLGVTTPPVASTGSNNAASLSGSAFGSRPFNCFSKSSASVSTIGGFPVKPLFGKASAPTTSTNEPTTVTISSLSSKSSTITTSNVQPAPPVSFPPTTTSSDLIATGSPRKEDISSSTKAENLHRTDKKELTGIEKTASCVFDKFDPTNSGFVPVSLFEDMSDALGEGFHGDEYDAQVNMVDPSKLGKITRNAFLAWYTSLVEGSNEDASLDSAEKEERTEEEENAKAAFGKLSKTEGEISYITLNQFGELLEFMGSTYCEEEHKKTLKKLKKDTDRIYQSDFLIWYIDWLFNDGDNEADDYSDGDYETDDDETNNVNKNGGNEESLGNIFKIDEDSWRCEICSVRNKERDNQCVACETSRAGAIVPTVGGKLATGTTSTSAIGAGGFSFGGKSPTSSSGGFKFNTMSNFTSNSIDNTNTPAPVSGFSFKSDTAVASPFLLSGANGSGTESSGQSKLPASNCRTFGKKDSVKSGTFAARPPMSCRAPSLFGATSSKPTVKAPVNSGTFAAIPPMPSKAPSRSPFGPQSSNTAMKAPAKSGTFSAIPPMSSKSKAAEKEVPASISIFAAFPLTSNKEPTLFGATSSKPTEKADPTSNNTFTAPPPMSSNSPSPFAAKSSKPAEISSTFTGNIVLSQISTSLDTKYAPGATVPQNLTRLSSRKKTKIQIQFDSVLSSFSRTVAEVSQMRVEASLDDNELQQEIEDLATQIQQERLIILNLDDSIRKNRGDTAFLLSRKTDSSRQINAARKMIKEIKLLDLGAESSVVYTQGLDQESETKRRRFEASSLSIFRQMALVRERVELLEATSDGHFNGKRKLLEGVLNLYKRSKYFKTVSSRIQEMINVASKTVPFNHRAKRVGTGQSTYALETQSFKSSKHLNKLRPISLGSGEKLSTKQQQTRSSKPLASHWKNIESSLQQIGNENIKIDRFNTLSAKCANNNQLLRDRKKEVREQRPGIHSLLMSPSISEEASGNRIQENSLILSKRSSIFSTPSKTKARNGWDQPSTIDQNRIKQLSLAAPRDLNQTTLSNASRDTLANFGTTPEKLQAATEMKKRESSSLAPDRVHPSVGQTKRSTDAKAVFPLKSTKVPTNPISNEKKKETVTPLSSTTKNITKSIASSAPLPPMPKQAPKNPFSKDLSTRSQDKSSNSAALPVPKSFSELQQNRITEGESLNLKKSEVSSGSFGNMNTISNSLFSSGSRETDTNPEPLQPISSLSNTSEAGKTNSFTSILTSFYQKHNPLKVGEVERTLEKYIGRESEMFAKLAAKYKVPNPLEGMTKKAATDGLSASSGFGNLGSTSAIPPTFCATGVTTSPFSSSSGTTGPQQNPAITSSPFGSSSPASSPALNTGMFSSNSGGFQSSNQSPFGTSNPSTNTAGFGSSPSATNGTALAQSPFGESTPFGAKTTGGFGNTTTPTPFGAPVSSPMQSNSQQLFNGRTARDLLLQFYQEKNPSKVTEVDKLLTKYRGNEDQMFRNLAKKYHLDCSVFGISSTTPNPGFSSVVATPAFSQASIMGRGPSPFGQSPGGFGQSSTLGGGNGIPSSSPAGQTFGSGSTASYGTSNFGSLTQASPSPFGQPSNFGSGNTNTGFGGSATTPAFGGSPFGAARR